MTSMSWEPYSLGLACKGPERETSNISICPYGPSPDSPFDPKAAIGGFFTSSPYNCSQLFKAGRSTKYTRGVYTGSKQAHILKEIGRDGQLVHRAMLQHAIVGAGEKPFPEKGDSGSLVLVLDGEVVGLLLGGSKAKNVSYFIHATDLVADIKAVTGAVAVRVMGSPL